MKKLPTRGVVLALAALAAFGVNRTRARYRHDIGLARERVATGSQIAQTPRGPIEYAVMGEGPPVILVHGAGGGYDQGLAFGGQIARAGYQIIAISRFGYLRTPLPADASAEAQADAHACLLDALGIVRAAIVGASAGAPSAMQFALRYPERCSALIMHVPATYVPRPQGQLPMKAPAGTRLLFETALKSDFLFWVMIRLVPDTLIESILATPAAIVAAADGVEQTRVMRLLQEILPVSRRRLGLLNDARVTSTLPRYALERIAVPTLIMSVEDDLFGTFDNARYTAAHVPGARFVGFPTGGHVWVGHQNEVVSEIADFLRGRV